MAAALTEVRAEYLHSFCLAARAGSITAAARQLGLTQPAVSRHLLLLQEVHGAPLYRRKGSGIELTPAGSALLPFACAASDSLTRARQFLSGELREGGTRLRIGLSHHLTTRFTGPLLRASRLYSDQGNLLRFHLLEAYSDDLLESLHTGSIDAAYLLEEPVPDRDPRDPIGGVQAETCGTERAMLLVKSDDPLGTEQNLPLSVVEGETLIVPSFASTMYRHVLDALSAAGVKPGRSIEVSGPAAVRSAVLDGLGIGMTIESFVRPEVTAGTLRLVQVTAKGTEMTILRLQRDDSHLFPDQRDALAFISERVAQWTAVS